MHDRSAIDYFRTPASEEEAILRGIKGEFRREMVARAMRDEDIDSVPDAWKEPGLSEALKAFLQGGHPQNRGGEDLPDLLEGEVEIARVVLLDSVHGEVTSLRARPEDAAVGGGKILLRMVDEYGNDFRLPRHEIDAPLTAAEVIEIFRDSDPSPLNTGCTVGFRSAFYPDIEDEALR